MVLEKLTITRNIKKPFNCVETIATLVCKQISSDSFKFKLLTTYSQQIIYAYLF